MPRTPLTAAQRTDAAILQTSAAKGAAEDARSILRRTPLSDADKRALKGCAATLEAAGCYIRRAADRI